MDLEALADFLTRRGLLLRSAQLGGIASESVESFTCVPAPVAPLHTPARDAPEATSAPVRATEPEALEAYLARKGKL